MVRRAPLGLAWGNSGSECGTGIERRNYSSLSQFQVLVTQRRQTVQVSGVLLLAVSQVLACGNGSCQISLRPEWSNS